MKSRSSTKPQNYLLLLLLLSLPAAFTSSSFPARFSLSKLDPPHMGDRLKEDPSWKGALSRKKLEIAAAVVSRAARGRTRLLECRCFFQCCRCSPLPALRYIQLLRRQSHTYPPHSHARTHHTHTQTARVGEGTCRARPPRERASAPSSLQPACAGLVEARARAFAMGLLLPLSYVRLIFIIKPRDLSFSAPRTASLKSVLDGWGRNCDSRPRVSPFLTPHTNVPHRQQQHRNLSVLRFTWQSSIAIKRDLASGTEMAGWATCDLGTARFSRASASPLPSHSIWRFKEHVERRRSCNRVSCLLYMLIALKISDTRWRAGESSLKEKCKGISPTQDNCFHNILITLFRERRKPRDWVQFKFLKSKADSWSFTLVVGEAARGQRKHCYISTTQAFTFNLTAYIHCNQCIHIPIPWIHFNMCPQWSFVTDP